MKVATKQERERAREKEREGEREREKTEVEQKVHHQTKNKRAKKLKESRSYQRTAALMLNNSVKASIKTKGRRAEGVGNPLQKG